MKLKFYNDRLRILPHFTPLNHYRYYVINQSTDNDLLHDIIRMAQKCQSFTLNTQLNLCRWNRPMCIQIEFVEKYLSTIILVEVDELPHNRKLLKFWLIQAIFKSIFQETKTIYVWGNSIYKLSSFLKYGLFRLEDLETSKCIDIQQKFKYWHSSTYVYCHDENTSNWDLQLAIAITYNEYLDESKLFYEWNQQSNGFNHHYFDTTNTTLIHFFCCQCLAITKLANKILKI